MSCMFFDGEGQPINHFGTPTSHPMAAPQPQAPPPGVPAHLAFAPPPTVDNSSSGLKVGAIIGAVVGGLAVLAAATVVAVPLYLDHQDRVASSHITVTLPDTIVGLKRVSTVGSSRTQDSIAALPLGLGNTPGAIYSDGGTTSVTVMASAHLMLRKDQKTFLTGVVRTEGTYAHLHMAPVPSGPLGGHLDCTTDSSLHEIECAFADAGCYGVIVAFAPRPITVSEVQQIRAQIEAHS